MDKLPREVLLLIFAQLVDIKSFTLLSRRYKRCVDAHWICINITTRFKVYEWLYQAIGRVVSWRVVQQLLTINPRCLSLDISNIFHARYTRASIHSGDFSLEDWLGSKWGTIEAGTSARTLHTVLEETYVQWTEWEGATNGQVRGRLGIFKTWERLILATKGITAGYSSNGHNNTVDRMNHLRTGAGDPASALEAHWEDLEASLRLHHFMSFGNDPATSTERLARAVILEPRLIPLFKAAGWVYDAEANDALVRSLLLDTLEANQSGGNQFRCFVNGVVTVGTRSQIVLRQLRDYITMSNGMFHISATIAGETMCVTRASDPDVSEQMMGALNIMIGADREGLLDFKLSDIAADVVRLQFNTRRGCSDSFPTIVHHGLRSTYTPAVADTALRASSLFTMLSVNCKGFGYLGYSTGPNPVGLRLYELEKIPWAPGRSECFSDLLCAEFLTLPGPALLRIEDKLSTDPSSIALAAVKKMIRLPSKGSTLLSLVSMYPFLIETIEHEIVRHKISLDALPLRTECKVDLSTPLFSYTPEFLSPIAFDYEDAQSRYPLGLGPDPWVENYYVVPANFPLSQPGFASSVWPAQPPSYFKVITGPDGTEQRLPRGHVTGYDLVMLPPTVEETAELRRRSRFRQYEAAEERPTLAPWTRERVPQGTLPLAIALLDLFDKDSEVLDIVLMHALLNVNPTVTRFYLLHGVPLRPHHAEAIERLSIPKMKCYQDHLLTGRTQDAPNPKTRRDRRKAKRTSKAWTNRSDRRVSSS